MNAQPQAVEGTAGQPPDIAVVDHIPPQVACQAHSITGDQSGQEARSASDQHGQPKERQAAVEEGIAMAANPQKSNIPVWKDRAEIARDERGQKDADGAILGAQGYIAHEEENPDQTVLGPISALLSEQGQHRPVQQDGGQNKDGDENETFHPSGRDRLALGMVFRKAHRVITEYIRQLALAQYICQHVVVVLTPQSRIARFDLRLCADTRQIK